MKKRRSVEFVMAVSSVALVNGGADRKEVYRGQTGTAAAAGMEAKEGRVVGEEVVSGSMTLVKSNNGGWSVGTEDGNHIVLYIWILKGERSGWGNGEWEWFK